MGSAMKLCNNGGERVEAAVSIEGGRQVFIVLSEN
jgi:hypothetical protein